MTLKQIVDSIINSINRPYDDMLYGRVRDLVINERSLLLRQQIHKYTDDKLYMQDYTVSLEKVSINTNSSNAVDYILRSVNKIPKPIFHKSGRPFYYVGSSDGKIPYTWRNKDQLYFIMDEPLISCSVGYSYVNGYIEIYNNFKISELLITATYESYEIYNSDETSTSGICYENDNYEFPLNSDLINVLISNIVEKRLTNIERADVTENTHLDNN